MARFTPHHRRAIAASAAYDALKAMGARLAFRQTDPKEPRFTHGPARITGTPLLPLDAGGEMGEDGGYIAYLAGERGWGRTVDQALDTLRRRLEPCPTPYPPVVALDDPREPTP